MIYSMANRRSYAQKRREELAALWFSLLFFSIIVLILFLALFSSGPVVLGTEMNTNGLVEYLCLGRGCEDMTDLRWVD